MPDISMCWGKDCPLKEDCYRYLAVPNEYRQSYFTTPPYDRALGECGFFWRAEKEDKIRAC
jgi:hypothetical protein